MFHRKKSLLLFPVVAILVVAIITGAAFLSVPAVIENLRYAHATSQILELVSTVRNIAAGQKGFAQNPGEDIWDDLDHVGQSLPADRLNPWGGQVNAVTVAGNAMRIETDLPSRDCRRLSLYLLGRQPAELGLRSIEAQRGTTALSARIYPNNTRYKDEKVVEIACGYEPIARLALVFLIRDH